MIEIGVYGAGYVGLVTGVCLAESGNKVVIKDINEERIRKLSNGNPVIYEPGLEEILIRNLQAGRVRFTTSDREAVEDSKLIIIATSTPESENGAADLSSVYNAAEQIGNQLAALKVDYQVIVATKSTVPPGTGDEIKAIFRKTAEDIRVIYTSVPEFLKEGRAIEDFTKPDRVVIGRDEESEYVKQIFDDLFSPFLRTGNPTIYTSVRSAETCKYGANFLLAARISAANEIADLCETYDANVDEVMRAITSDVRIGKHFLFPGIGYGGSCFQKDLAAFRSMVESRGIRNTIAEAVMRRNDDRSYRFTKRIIDYYKSNLHNKTLAVWGLSFKPQTDDIREAPAVKIIKLLLGEGANISVHDPVAIDNVRRKFGDRLRYEKDSYDALDGADGLVICTEWNEYRNPDFAEIKKRLKTPVIFDGRNIHDLEKMNKLGFDYFSIGRPVVRGYSKK